MNSEPIKIRVLLADDHTIVRQGLRLLLESTGDIEVVADAGNGKEAVELAQALRPDVIILDILMPVLNGIEAAHQILGILPRCRILMLSSFSDEESIRRLIRDGVAGYLVKQSASTELIAAIRKVFQGKAYFSPKIERHIFGRGRKRHSDITKPKGKQSLTLRERQVLALIALGLRNKAIAENLAISSKTVEKHRQQVMHKLDIHEAAGLTRYAISTGLIESNSRPGDIDQLNRGGVEGPSATPLHPFHSSKIDRLGQAPPPP